MCMCALQPHEHNFPCHSFKIDAKQVGHSSLRNLGHEECHEWFIYMALDLTVAGAVKFRREGTPAIHTEKPSDSPGIGSAAIEALSDNTNNYRTLKRGAVMRRTLGVRAFIVV